MLLRSSPVQLWQSRKLCVVAAVPVLNVGQRVVKSSSRKIGSAKTVVGVGNYLRILNAVPSKHCLREATKSKKNTQPETRQTSHSESPKSHREPLWRGKKRAISPLVTAWTFWTFSSNEDPTSFPEGIGNRAAKPATEKSTWVVQSGQSAKVLWHDRSCTELRLSMVGETRSVHTGLHSAGPSDYRSPSALWK